MNSPRNCFFGKSLSIFAIISLLMIFCHALNAASQKKAPADISQVRKIPEKRQLWNSRFAFIMAAIGSAVGLGNIWRFPYMCYKHGGGAFFIPFFIAIFTLGIPLLILAILFRIEGFTD